MLTHVVIPVAAFDGKGSLTQSSELAKGPRRDILVIASMGV